MKRAFTYALSLLLAACSQAAGSSSAPTEKPVRIVSLDLCADQYVLKFAERENILALSPEAGLQISYMRDAAKGLPRVRPLAENILNLQPDLIVRTYGGGPNAKHFFEEAGIPVLEVGWTATVDDILNVVTRMSAELGEPEKGIALRKSLEKRLSKINPPDQKAKALYLTASGYTTGTNTLIDDIFNRAGLENFISSPGWKSLPLEQLTQEQPDLIALAYHETLNTRLENWSPTRNPVATRLISGTPTVKLDGAVVSCSGWYIVDAIEALAAKAGK